MNQTNWISIIALAGWLVLALSAYRTHRIGGKKTLVLAFSWLAIFLLAAAIFTAIGNQPR